MELKLKDVQLGLVTLALHYPEAGHSEATLMALAKDYLEDLTAEGFDAERFSRAVSMARRRCRYFPKIVDLLECGKAIGTLVSANDGKTYEFN